MALALMATSVWWMRQIALVLIDVMNRRRESGCGPDEATLESGRSRFRPVLLTSVTTVVARRPVLFERNTQAQNLIPMALSIADGFSLTTVRVLLFVPVRYLLGANGRRDAAGSDTKRARIQTTPQVFWRRYTLNLLDSAQRINTAGSKKHIACENAHRRASSQDLQREPVRAVGHCASQNNFDNG